ncbi:RVT_3 domain-containing protein [Cephalotus follicularis]|uniref:RVT_3 domain-containing protein n=1 Tax=Cephalotus follicularis TaxID=3775 RepID=A0A1Q3B611_CEPFO|nr:RVT_3 domain-containing protein [Cephalotus follicularis]
MDGSSRGNPGMAGVGGLIRDVSLEAELWGIRAGLQLVWQRQLAKIIVETDSLLSINLINEDPTTPHPLDPPDPIDALIDDCRSL